MKRRSVLKGLLFIYPLRVLAKEKGRAMSYIIHRAHERGVAEHGWLHSRFSFSFAGYFNPRRMGFGVLRVINDDVIEAGQGFDMHPHSDMEIITIVTQGAVEHKDSEGNHAITKAGEIQYMSAGSGIRHSEYATADHDAALYQIWIHPNYTQATPRYDKRDFSDVDQKNHWAILASEDGREGSMQIRQSALLYSSVLEKGTLLDFPHADHSHGRLLFIMEGEVEIAGELLKARDEMQIIRHKEAYSIRALEDSKVLLFDVPLN